MNSVNVKGGKVVELKLYSLDMYKLVVLVLYFVVVIINLIYF